MPETVYIIGPVGEFLDELECEFVQNEYTVRTESLKEMGFNAINPMLLLKPETNWESAMAVCIPLVMACHFISPITSAWGSRAAIVLFNLARQAGKEIILPNIENTNENSI